MYLWCITPCLLVLLSTFNNQLRCYLIGFCIYVFLDLLSIIFDIYVIKKIQPITIRPKQLTFLQYKPSYMYIFRLSISHVQAALKKLERLNFTTAINSRTRLTSQSSYRYSYYELQKSITLSEKV
jgi:hypothetical protein